MKDDIQTTWDAALSVDSTTGNVVTTEPRADKKIHIDFTKTVAGAEEENEVTNLMTHGNGRIAIRQLFDRLHITVHVYHDRFEIRGFLLNGKNNISSLIL
jgi:site-specific DNA recombinase